MFGFPGSQISRYPAGKIIYKSSFPSRAWSQNPPLLAPNRRERSAAGTASWAPPATARAPAPMSGWLQPHRAPSPVRVGPLGIPGSALRCRQGSGCRRLAWLEMVRIVVQKGWKVHNFAIFRFRRRFSDNKEHIASVVQQSAPLLVVMEAYALPSPVPAI